MLKGLELDHVPEVFKLQTEDQVAGAKIKYIRHLLGIKQSYLANQLNVKGSYLSLIENGSRPIKVTLLNKLMSIYSINANWFFFNIGDIFIDENGQEQTS